MPMELSRGAWFFSYVEVLGNGSSGATGPLPTHLLGPLIIGAGCVAGIHRAHSKWSCEPDKVFKALLFIRGKYLLPVKTSSLFLFYFENHEFEIILIHG